MSLEIPARDIASRADIELLVSAFYTQVRSDALIGELFAHSVGNDWPAHEARVCDFWEMVLLGSARFKSRALLGHLDVDEICPLCPHHFQRWCDLFGSALECHFEGECARRAHQRARAMSAALCNQLQRERKCPFAAFKN